MILNFPYRLNEGTTVLRNATQEKKRLHEIKESFIPIIKNSNISVSFPIGYLLLNLIQTNKIFISSLLD
jgi:hypothetical protein